MELSLFLSYVSGQGMLILGNVHHAFPRIWEGAWDLG